MERVFWAEVSRLRRGLRRSLQGVRRRSREDIHRRPGRSRFLAALQGAGAGIDIVIDDGAHRVIPQSVTLEELLPHLRPGGVFLCEDLYLGFRNEFTSYMNGFTYNLNVSDTKVDDPPNLERSIVCQPTGFQEAVHSIHWYPFVVVIERRQNPIGEFLSPKRGTQWQTFYHRAESTGKQSSPAGDIA